MSLIQAYIKGYPFNRSRTLDLLNRIEELPCPAAVLGWRPGPGRAHIAWQLMHVAVTEEIFATERLAPEKPRHFEEFWPRFRGGSTPDDSIPSSMMIREVLSASRGHLLATLHDFSDEQLATILPAMVARGFTLEQILHLIGFHEAHHQGQAHLTLNLYKAAHGIA